LTRTALYEVRDSTLRPLTSGGGSANTARLAPGRGIPGLLARPGQGWGVPAIRHWRVVVSALAGRPVGIKAVVRLGRGSLTGVYVVILAWCQCLLW